MPTPVVPFDGETKSSCGIPISTLNPDSDGDGKVEPWELEVFERIKSADEDQSGSISVKELFNVIKSAAASDKEKKMYRKLLIVAVILIFLLTGSMLAVSIAAGELVKEMRVEGGNAEMKAADGTTVKVDTVLSVVDFWDTPSIPTNYMTKLDSLTLYMDMDGTWAEATYKVAGAYKTSSNVARLRASSGETITIDSDTQTGTIKMVDGTTYPISDYDPTNPGRRMFMASAADGDGNPREAMRKLFFNAAPSGGAVDMGLLTSGSFVMMSSSGL